jgi:hypothetical protein
MKLAAFDDVIERTPVFIPVFRITKVPGWAREYVKVGDLLRYWNGGMYTKQGKGIRLGATYVEFFEYQTPQEWK